MNGKLLAHCQTQNDDTIVEDKIEVELDESSNYDMIVFMIYLVVFCTAEFPSDGQC